MSNPHRSWIPWWYWIWLVHIVFVGVMFMFMFTPFKPEWFHRIFSSISLGHERNYAVWWSGICLFIASGLFYRIASAESKISKSWKWIILSVGLLALAFDEIGSLHEMISKFFGGWKGLLPFALVFMAGFGAALFSLLRKPGFRAPAILIILGMSVFASVAMLEFVEHNIKLNSHQQRTRLIIEEGLELFGMSLIIIAGVISLPRVGVNDRRLSEVIGGVFNLAAHPAIVFLLFAIQLFMITAVVTPHTGLFSEGSPGSVFPIFLNFVLAMMCIHISHKNPHGIGAKFLWWVFATIFLFTSLCQIRSFAELLTRLDFDFPWFVETPDTWLITLLPYLLLMVTFVIRRWISIKLIIPDLILMVCIIFVLYPDKDLYLVYFVYSSCIAYICYRLLHHYLIQETVRLKN